MKNFKQEKNFCLMRDEKQTKGACLAYDKFNELQEENLTSPAVDHEVDVNKRELAPCMNVVT